MVLASVAPTFAEPGASTAEHSGTMQRANPDMRMVLDQLVKLGAKPIGTQSVADTRKGPTPADAVKAVLKAKGQDPVALMASLKVTKKDLSYPVEGGTQAVRIYTPEHTGEKALPVVVYFHGGGWVIADLDTYEASAMAMAHKTNAIFVSVEYRHAPEHKFPAAHDDAIAAYKWVIANAASFGGDPSRIAVAGESAGGNLAANVAIAARDQKLQTPMHMLLVYPVSGTNTDTPSYQKNEMRFR
jgi:acetyl esterase